MPNRFRQEILHNLAVYLYRSSQSSSALDDITHVYTKMYKGASNVQSLNEYKIKDGYQTSKDISYLEFSLRMHPFLNHIMALYSVPGFEQASAKIDAATKSIKNKILPLQPLQQQIALRLLLREIIEAEDNRINPYTYKALLNVANELSGDRASKRLANGLIKIIGPLSLFPRLNAGLNQVKKEVRKTIGSNASFETRRVFSSLRNTFRYSLDNTLWTSTHLMLGAGFITWNSFYYLTASIYPVKNQANNLGLWLPALMAAGTHSLKFLYLYLYSFSEVNPYGILENETNHSNTSIENQLTITVESILQDLGLGSISVNIGPNQSTPAEDDTAEDDTVEEVLNKTSSQTDAPGLAEGFVQGPDVTEIDQDVEIPTTLILDLSSFENVSLNDLNIRLNETLQVTTNNPKFNMTTEQEASNRAFFDYFSTLASDVILERDLVLDHIQLGLLMPGPANILILGEPGTAKSYIAQMALGNIKMNNGETSFFRHQMGPNTTIGELVGVVKPSMLEEDRIVRASERAMPGHQTAFLDEYFDAPVDSRRDLLTLQSDGQIRLAGETYASQGRVTLYASNLYPDQVFLEAGNDKPRAEFDRMLFTHIVSPTFEYDSNMINLPDPSSTVELPELKYSDIDRLSPLFSEIEVPTYFSAKIKLFVNRLRRVEIHTEQESVREWKLRDRAGEVQFSPPNRMTRVLSPRSEATANKLIRAYAFFDWLFAKSQGLDVGYEPVITEEHFARLNEYFLYNSASEEHLQRIMREYPNDSLPHQQFSNINQRRTRLQNLNSSTNKNIYDSPRMKTFSALLEKVGVSLAELEFGRFNVENLELTEENAPIFAALIQFYTNTRSEVESYGDYREISTDQIGAMKALHLSEMLLRYLK